VHVDRAIIPDHIADNSEEAQYYADGIACNASVYLPLSACKTKALHPFWTASPATHLCICHADWTLMRGIAPVRRCEPGKLAGLADDPLAAVHACTLC
jgi:hypothetical protein